MCPFWCFFFGSITCFHGTVVPYITNALQNEWSSQWTLLQTLEWRAGWTWSECSELCIWHIIINFLCRKLATPHFYECFYCFFLVLDSGLSSFYQISFNNAEQIIWLSIKVYEKICSAQQISCITSFAGTNCTCYA